MKKRIISLLVVVLLLMQICACSQTEQPVSSTEQQPVSSESEVPAAELQPEAEEEDAPAESQSTLEVYDLDDDAAIARAIEGSFDFSEHKAMLNSLTAQYPVADEPATLSMWINFESTMLTYIEGNSASPLRMRKRTV